MYATNYFENKVLNVMKNIAFEAPLNVYVGLFLTNPTDAGAGVEINYENYERQLVQFSTAAEENAVVQIKNINQIKFPESAVDSGTVTHMALFDSKIAGNMLAYGRLVEDLEVRAGEAPVLMQGEVIVHSAGQMSKAYKKKVLNVFKGETLYGINPHVALFNGSPESGGAELLGDNYERVAVEFVAPSENASGQAVTTNQNEVIFNRPTTDWGLWNFTVIMDAKTSGQPVWIHNRGITKELKKGYMPTAAVGALKFAFN